MTWFHTETTGRYQFDRATGRNCPRHRLVRNRPLGGFTSIVDPDFDSDGLSPTINGDGEITSVPVFASDPVAYDSPIFGRKTLRSRAECSSGWLQAQLQKEWEDAERHKQMAREKQADEEWGRNKNVSRSKYEGAGPFVAPERVRELWKNIQMKRDEENFVSGIRNAIRDKSIARSTLLELVNLGVITQSDFD